MLLPTKRFTLAVAVVVLVASLSAGQGSADKDLLPPRLPQEQRENLQRFLKEHEKPDRFVPADAKVVDTQPPGIDPGIKGTPEKPIKQYMVQITSHRPVPDQAEVKRVDVYYYRPNPERGKPGVTVKHTVDLATGKQVGPTEVLFNRHTPFSREELAEALALAREKSTAVGDLYKDRAENMVRWEYLQIMIGRKHEPHEPGDRVVRFVFTAVALKDQAPPAPVAVVVNLTKGVVVKDER
jgi:hypothetical protein